jgi:hypothetical protein
MVTLWKKNEKGDRSMGNEESMPIEATIQQTEGSVDYFNSEKLAPEGAPPAQEIAEPVPSGSAVEVGSDVQANVEESASDVTVSTETELNESPVVDVPAETETDTKPMEDTMPESTNAAADIAAKAATIHKQTTSFETDFDTEQTTQDDLLKQIIDLMVERTRLLTILRDSLGSMNIRLAEFNAAKVEL